MKRTHFPAHLLALLIAIGGIVDMQLTYAQVNPPATPEKRTIIIKEIDDDGNEKVITKNIEIDRTPSGDKQRPYMGILIEDNATEGVVISEVNQGSPAAKAGLQEGDRIVSINRNIVKNYSELLAELDKCRVGETITVDYARAGNVKSTQVTLAEPPMRREKKMRRSHEPGACSDASATDKTPAKAFLGVTTDNDKKGARITALTPNAPAYYAAFEKEDIIYKVHDTDVRNNEELTAAITAHKPGDVVTIYYYRNGKKESKNVRLGSRAKSLDRYINREEIERTIEDAKEKAKEIKVEDWIDNEQLERALKQFEEELEKMESEFKKKKDSKRADVPPTDQTERRSTASAEPGKDTPSYDLSISVFPNPTASNVNIVYKTPVIAPIRVRITDSNGAELFSESVQDFNGSYNKEVNLPRQASGFCILTIQQNDSVISEKIIVEDK